MCFVVQLHDATTLHFDLSLQFGEVLRSWAVPKGPSLDPGVRRLAIEVSDHDLAAGEFESVLAHQTRGSGAVKLSDRFALTRTATKQWILVKVRDEHARPGSDVVVERPASTRSGRTWRQLLPPSGSATGSDRPRS